MNCPQRKGKLMKIYVPNPDPLTRAFLQVFPLFGEQGEAVSIDEAEIVLVTKMADLRAAYREDKFFGIIDTGRTRVPDNQPTNVFVMNGRKSLMHGEHGAAAFHQAFEGWQAWRASQPQERSQEAPEVPSDLVTMSRSYGVLIVDDSEENLSTTMTLLVGQQILPVKRLEDAVKYLHMEGKTFDAVLTDMQMPPDKTYGALNLDGYGINETVPYGFAVILEATKRGIPVAVVTDANHHQDWVSAMFDSIKEVNVNGQRVLFFNNIGKRWDKALKALLEPEA